MEFPNPLLEHPIKEENGEIIIPGNKALINLNLSRKFFSSIIVLVTSSLWYTLDTSLGVSSLLTSLVCIQAKWLIEAELNPVFVA